MRAWRRERPGDGPRAMSMVANSVVAELKRHRAMRRSDAVRRAGRRDPMVLTSVALVKERAETFARAKLGDAEAMAQLARYHCRIVPAT